MEFGSHDNTQTIWDVSVWIFPIADPESKSCIFSVFRRWCEEVNIREKTGIMRKVKVKGLLKNHMEQLLDHPFGRWEAERFSPRLPCSIVSEFLKCIHIPDFWIALSYKQASSHDRELTRMWEHPHLLLRIPLRLHELTRISSSQKNKDAIAGWRGMDSGQRRLLDTYLREVNQ